MNIYSENEKSLSITHYTPQSALRHPRQLLRQALSGSPGRYELTWRIIRRDITAQYRASFLGLAWMIAEPLVLTGAFTLLQSQGVVTVEDTGLPYPLYVMLGTVLWTLFTATINTVLSDFQASAGLLNKINFAREALIGAAVGKVAINFSVSATIFAIIVWLSGMSFPPTLLLAPFFLFSLILLGLVVGLILLPFTLLVADVGRLIGYAITALFYLTPVVYPPDVGGALQTLVNLNPVTPVLVSAREAIIYGQFTQLGGYILVTSVCLMLLLLGLLMVNLAMPILIERMNT